MWCFQYSGRHINIFEKRIVLVFQFSKFFQKKVKKNYQGKLLAQNFGAPGARRSGKLLFGSYALGSMVA